VDSKDAIYTYKQLATLYSADAQSFPLGLKMQLVQTTYFKTRQMATARSIRLLELQQSFLSMTKTLRTPTVNNYLLPQQALDILLQLTHPTKPALHAFHAISPLLNARGYIICYQSKMHMMVRAVIAWLLHFFMESRAASSLHFPLQGPHNGDQSSNLPTKQHLSIKLQYII